MTQRQKLSHEQIRKIVGNPADVDREIQELRKSALLLSSQRPRLIDEYPQQWIGVYQGAVKASADTLQELFSKIDAVNIPRSAVLVRYIERNIATLIL